MAPDDQAALLAAVVFGALYLAPGVLTGLGQWRRTRRVGSAVVATLFWPVAWVVWYARERFGPAAAAVWIHHGIGSSPHFPGEIPPRK